MVLNYPILYFRRRFSTIIMHTRILQLGSSILDAHEQHIQFRLHCRAKPIGFWLCSLVLTNDFLRRPMIVVQLNWRDNQGWFENIGRNMLPTLYAADFSLYRHVYCKEIIVYFYVFTILYNAINIIKYAYCNITRSHSLYCMSWHLNIMMSLFSHRYNYHNYLVFNLKLYTIHTYHHAAAIFIKWPSLRNLSASPPNVFFS